MNFAKFIVSGKITKFENLLGKEKITNNKK
jgi:hypothetical protein